LLLASASLEQSPTYAELTDYLSYEPHRAAVKVAEMASAVAVGAPEPGHPHRVHLSPV